MAEFNLRVIDQQGQTMTFGKSRPYLLSKLNGNNVSANIVTSSGSYDGTNIDGVSIKEKTITIEGSIVGENKIDMEDKRAKMLRFLNPRKSLSFIYTNHKFTRRADGIVQTVDFQEEVNNMQKFQIQILIPAPFWYEEYDRKNEVALWTKDASFVLHCSPEKPIVFGHRVSNLLCNVYNAGDVSTGMRIHLRALATVVNPSVLNIYTHEFIKINRTLEAGDTLEISTVTNKKRIEILRSDGSRENVLNWLTIDSDFIQLDVGDNVFRYDAEEGIDNLEMTIYNNPAYLGM